jgi:muramidase (phage lysozyme)
LNLGTALALLGSVGAATGLARLFGLFSLARGGVSAATGLAAMVPPLAAIAGVVTQHGDTMDPENKGTQGPGGELFGRNGPIARWLGIQPDLAYKEGMSDAQQDFLKDLSSRESQGAYNVKNGGSTFSDYSRFPEGVGPGGESTAAGRYQFTSGTWKEVSGQLGLKDFSPASQDKAAWYLAMTEYRRKTGRDLEFDLRQGGHTEDVNNALRGRWPSLPGASVPAMPSRGYSGNGKQSSLTGGNTSTVAINTINVQTAATDATGIAASIKGAIANSFIAQANPGYA